MGHDSRQIGRYEIQERIGSGGMGTLYIARDPTLNRFVAIKLLHADLDTTEVRERFTREARATGALNHPNIVTIHDYGEHENSPYIVMEYIRGETLLEIIRRHAKVSLVQKLRWMEELCAGLWYAHAAGIIHRDIKPANLMIDSHGRLKILDFGIARMATAIATRATALIGTPGYMAPEQLNGGTVDQRSDLFAAGTVCYELLSYADAFAGETPGVIMAKVLQYGPRPLPEVYPEVDPELADIITRALQKDPGHRHSDAAAMQHALEGVRRRLDSGDKLVVPVRGRRPSLEPAGAMAPQGGTGDSKVDATDDRVMPSPTPVRRRSDREALARRRAAQIEEALTRARRHLETGDYDAALDECEQAATLDETHPQASALLDTARAAIDRRDAAALLVDARAQLAGGAVTRAGELLERARALDPANVDLGAVDRDVRIARADRERVRKRAEAVRRALETARRALEQRELETALVHAREAVDLDPFSTDAKVIEREVLAHLDAIAVADLDTRAEFAIREARRLADLGEVESALELLTAFSPAHPRVALALAELQVGTLTSALTTNRSHPDAATVPMPLRAGAVAKQQSATPQEIPVMPTPQITRSAWWDARRLVDTIAGGAPLTRQTSRQLGMLAAAVALLLAFSLGTWLWPRPPVQPVSGGLVIDAAPWATVTKIEGQAPAATLQPMTATPLFVKLSPGEYVVTLVGPPPRQEQRTVRVRIESNRTDALPVQQFDLMTPERYFDKYHPLQPATAQGTPAGQQ